jgi:hypothetical protein
MPMLEKEVKYIYGAIAFDILELKKTKIRELLD